MTQQLSYFYECTNIQKVGIENSSRTPVNTKKSQQNYSKDTKINEISITLWICLSNKMLHESKVSYQKCSFLHLNFKSRQQCTIAADLRIGIKEAIQCRNCLESGSNDTSGMGKFSTVWSGCWLHLQISTYCANSSMIYCFCKNQWMVDGKELV